MQDTGAVTPSADEPLVSMRHAMQLQHVLTSVRVLQSEFAISPGLEAALAEMDTAEAAELARKKTLAELLSAKRAELNSLVSIVCVY
jgi:hypothetical protein